MSCLEDKTYKELCDLQLDITNEFVERFMKDAVNHADEFVAIKEVELAVGSLRGVLEQSGKIN